jgi:hypothetical protein
MSCDAEEMAIVTNDQLAIVVLACVLPQKARIDRIFEDGDVSGL